MGRRYMRNLCEYLFESSAIENGMKCTIDVCAVDFFGNRSSMISSTPIRCRRWSPA